MVGEQLRMVFGTAQRIDPLSRTPVSLGLGRPRDLVVGDGAKQLMAEGVLGVASDGGVARPLNELPTCERLQKPVNVPARDAAHRLERAEPEDPSDDRRILQQSFLGIG
jgi:hypothetical protein